jgi:flagellin-like protein
MRKLLRSKKALSPVVAAIILIAVTVAVSIAVAVWMGALTTGFMGSSSITITNVTFCDTNLVENITASGVTNNTIVLTLKNTGTKQVTIGQVKVNNVVKSTFSGTLTLNPGDANKPFNIWMGSNPWWIGNPYKIDLYDTSGSIVASTQQNAPGA